MRLTLYTHQDSTRLRYVVHLLERYASIQVTVTTSRYELPTDASEAVLIYSPESIEGFALHIVPHGLLEQSGIASVVIQDVDWKGFPVLFPTPGTLPADVFAALFYVVSRYEEYLPTPPDSYGRFDYQQSWMQRSGVLQVPIAHVWMTLLGQTIQQFYPRYSFTVPAFRLAWSFDIDMGWMYQHKPWWLRLWYLLQSEGRRVLRGKQNDPADIYAWLDSLHQQHHVNPTYFFHVGRQRGRYDKQVLPDVPAMQSLVRNHGLRYPLGWHPSWRSGDDRQVWEAEKEGFEQLTGKPVQHSRQHYIRMQLPRTYRQLLDAGILHDHSMGYGSTQGFRAGMAMEFPWYDVERDQLTKLLLHPFCFMDANSIFEHRESAEVAEQRFRALTAACVQYGGTMSSVWHNIFLADTSTYSYWRHLYQQLLTAYHPVSD
jgi:hypothetical protein